MCGITGFIDKTSKTEKEKIIKKMMDRIIHRGPDSSGTYIDDEVALGFRRLSIIDLKNYNESIKNMALAEIEDLGDKKVSHEDVRFHKTVINKYEKSKSIASLYMASAVEYYRKENDGIRKKVQDRFLVEIIYVIDPTEVGEDEKLLGLNCPNCGAPITTLGEKFCKYCNTGIKDLVKRSWVVNNIKEY